MNDNQARVPRGVRSGGQFAVGARRESNVAVLAAPLDNVVPNDGSVPIGEGIHVSRVRGSDVFMVTHVLTDRFIETVSEARDSNERATVAWVADNEAAIQWYLVDRYSAYLETDLETGSMRIEQVAVVPCDSTTVDAVRAVESAWNADRLEDDLNHPIHFHRLLTDGINAYEAINDEHETGAHDSDSADGCAACDDNVVVDFAAMFRA